MWISKEKYDALVDRICALENKKQEPVMVELPTGKEEWKLPRWGGAYMGEIMHKMDVRDAILAIIKAADICIDYTPAAKVEAFATLKKCDKKGK